MDKHQELRTNLVLEANSALSAIRELSDGLNKISRLKFDNVKDGFKSLTKAFEAAQKMSTKVARVQSDDEKRFQSLLQQRAKIMKEMLDGYSKDRGFAKTEKWDGLRSQFESANIEIANFMKLSGRASEAVKYLQEALIAVANTPLYDPLKNQLAKLKVDLKSIKNDVNDRVSELDGTKQGKIDKVVSKELSKQADQQAKDHAAEQKAIADKVRANVNASKQAREAAEKTRQERAKAREEEAKAKAEQQKKDSEALQKYLGQKQAAYAKELEAEAKLARTRKENEEKRIEAAKKRQELNEKEWNGVQAALGKMERAPHRNDLYKTTGDYYPEMNRRLRVQQEEINKAKELSAIKEANDKKELQRKKDIEKLMKDIAKLEKDIENHRGANGQGYSKKAYDNTVNRIDNLQGRAKDLGLDGLATVLNASMLNGVNTKLGQFNNRLSEAKDRAQQLYMKFRETGNEADKLNFLKAKADLKELNNLAEDFDKAISKARRHDLTVGNIAKRAREAANWQIGGRIETAIVDFPSDVISSVSKYELAMAGIAQVMPKVEEGQAQANEQFKAFADIAAKYGQSIDNALESARSIGRMYGQGDGNADIGAVNTSLLTAQAAKMATVDNFDMLDATKGLESALAQFNLQTEDTNLLMERSGKILDVWTKLAHTSGASAQDLTQGVNQAGSSAREAGISFEFLNALIATGVRSTAKSGNEIGTTLKSMFASIQSDKAIKAMQKFGIEMYRVGQNGQRELRPLQDVILDISRTLETTPKDTKEVNDFLLAISGGKFQVSKIAAILGNYKELKRTMEEADNSAGFTNKQLEIQLGTISRKWETLKANVSQWFAQSGADGLANDLKWILDSANRIVKALMDSDAHFYNWAKMGVKILVAWKAIPALIGLAAKALGRFAGASAAAGRVGTSSPVGSFWDGVRTQYQSAKYGAIKKEISGASYILRENAALRENQSMLVNNSQKAAKYVSSHQKLNSVFAKSPGLVKAAAGSITLFTGAVSLSRGILAALGGPIGIALVGLSVLGEQFLVTAEDAEALSQKKEELLQKTEEVATTTALELEKHEEAKKRAEDLAEQYNKLVDSLNELQKADDGTTESARKQNEIRQQMKLISDEVQATLHANAIEFDEDGKINKDIIEKLAAADREATVKKIEDAQAEITAAKDASDANGILTMQRINQHQAELESITATSMAYKAFYAVIAGLESAMVAFKKASVWTLKNTFVGGVARAVFGKARVDGWIEADESEIQSMWEDVVSKVKMVQDPTNLDARLEIEKAKKDLERYQSESNAYNDQWNDLEGLKIGLDFDKRTGKYYKQKKVDPSGEDVNAGKVHPESDAEKKEREKAEKKAAREAAKAEKQKDIVSFRTDEVMDYVNTVSKETGTLPIGQLLSFAAALNGHNDPWKVRSDYYSDKDIFKVPEALTNKYADGRTDEESRFWAFSKWLQDNQARFKGYEGALEEYFKLIHPQTSDEELKRLAKEWQNEGEYFDSKHNYGKNKTVLTHHSAYGAGYATGDVITGSQYDDYINRMAERYGVDKVLAHQIAEQESTHGKASSNVMQVIDSTGRAMGFSDMSDPFQSIEAGLKYFAELLNNNNGNIEAALKAYNGGGDPNYVEHVLGHKYTPAGVNGADSVWDKAAEHLKDQGLQDYGAGAENLGLQCAAFVSKVLVEAGIKGLNSVNVDELARQADAQGLYHSADSGYKPQKGDIYIWGHHTGFADGQGNYIARNSTEGVHFGNELDYRGIFGGLRGYISTGSLLGGGTQAAYQWKNSETNGQPSLLNWRPNKQNTIQEWYENQQELFKIQAQEVKMLEDAGQIAEAINRQSKTAKDSALTQATYLAVTKQNVLTSYKKFINKMSEDSDIQAALKRNGTTLTQISSSDMDELIQRMKTAGKNTEEIEKLWKVVKEFKFDSHGNSTKLQGLELEEQQKRIEAAKADGYMTPQEEEDYALNALDMWYEQESSGKIFQDPRLEEEYHRQRATVYQERLDRLKVEAEKADEEAPEKKERLRQNVIAAKENRDAKANALHNAKTPEEIEKANRELQEAQNALDLQSETWRNVEQHGTQAQRKVAEETVKTKNELAKEQQAAYRVEHELTQKLGNGVKSMFSDVLMEGKSFQDAWKSLWTDIGKFALDRLLEIQLSRWGFDGLFGRASGGKVDKKATGGKIPTYATGGYTNGLIRGAGTGTSDSILTYLAHRGQFIQTSNGEYIIQEKAVKKLGIPFLDTLNNNPESIGALNGLKRYANGGSLGESYSPSMSIKGVEAYKTFNKSNMEKQQYFSTRKMEGLLQGLRDDVQDGNRNSGAVTQPIILNTQADSASVMKAIAKNPRALQAILGNNQRRGFR